MSEPKVEFDLTKIEDDSIRSMMDDIRAWYEYRDDRKTPAVQTFEGELETSEEIFLEVNGNVYGYSGMTTRGNGDHWVPMEYSAAAPSNRCYFALELDNVNGTFVKVRCNSTNGTQKYRATIFFI